MVRLGFFSRHRAATPQSLHARNSHRLRVPHVHPSRYNTESKAGSATRRQEMGELDSAGSDTYAARHYPHRPWSLPVQHYHARLRASQHVVYALGPSHLGLHILCCGAVLQANGLVLRACNLRLPLGRLPPTTFAYWSLHRHSIYHPPLVRPDLRPATPRLPI